MYRFERRIGYYSLRDNLSQERMDDFPEVARMTARTKLKRIVDLGMTLFLLLLMAYARIGEACHEVLGCTMFALMAAHIALNFSWYRSLGKGRYSAFRVVQTVLDFLILGSMLTSLASGIRLSRHVFEPLGLTYNISVARIAHLLASHWGFCLMSIHLGMHWSVLASGRRGENGTGRALPAPWSRHVPGAAARVLAAFGLWAFIRRGLWRYMLLVTRFVFLDFEEALPLFLADHAAIMAFFILLGFMLAKAVRGAFRQDPARAVPGPRTGPAYARRDADDGEAENPSELPVNA